METSVARWRRSLIALAIVAVVAVAGVLSYVVLVPSSGTKGSSTRSGTASCSSSAAGASSGNWTTYHEDLARTGVGPAAGVSGVRAEWSGPTSLDGAVYAEPLVCGDAVYVATEENTVYAINLTNGGVLWETHLGAPVPKASLQCGDINPTGITGTPVIDLSTGTLYALAFLSPAQHVLFGLSVSNGTVRSRTMADPSGSIPTAEQQRGALALANGYVYVPYGGLFGDCANYRGWVEGIPTEGGANISYQVPTHREGGIWAAGGITVAPNGNLYVATGNGDSSTTFDYGDSVIELSPTLTELGYFAPTNWASLNAGDADLGSLAPTLLPNGDVFQVGKQGVGYLLSGANLGGIGGQIYNATVCGGGAYGGTAHDGLTVLVPCTDGLVALTAGTGSFSIDWRTSAFDAGSPIVTGNVTWVVDIDTAQLLGFNLTTGELRFSFPLGSTEHFETPAASPGNLFVGVGNALDAFALI